MVFGACAGQTRRAGTTGSLGTRPPSPVHRDRLVVAIFLLAVKKPRSDAVVLSGGAERSGAGPALRGCSQMGAEGGNEPGLHWQLPSVLPGIGRARHDTPPSAPIWVPPLRSPAPERPALVNEYPRADLGRLVPTDGPRGHSPSAGTGEGAGGGGVGGTPMRSEGGVSCPARPIPGKTIGSCHRKSGSFPPSDSGFAV